MTFQTMQKIMNRGQFDISQDEIRRPRGPKRCGSNLLRESICFFFCGYTGLVDSQKRAYIFQVGPIEIPVAWGGEGEGAEKKEGEADAEAKPEEKPKEPEKKYEHLLGSLTQKCGCFTGLYGMLQDTLGTYHEVFVLHGA